ncbi:MAG TPA: zinc ABC transporter substrate-binding protein [Candidatus Angelobacter sp.]|nr:zinc ABC transporter substrate-binding protein [Candidatus Angelobacter sp.]
MYRRSFLQVVLIAPLLLVPLAAHAADGKLKVVASFSILGDIVKNVGGDRVAVTTLVGPDGDAHVFEPTPADARAVAAADVVVVNGLGLEGWMQRLIQASDYKGPVVAASAGVKSRTMDEDGATVTDPHAWQDLSNGRLYVANVAAGLAAADPQGAAAYRAAAAAYTAAIEAKDEWVRAELKDVPSAQRRIITSHDAFGYFGAAYGITFLAPVGVSTEAEPSAAGIAKLIRQMRSEGIKVVFFENMTSPKLVETLASESGARVGGTLFSDALSPTGGPADSYLKMFDNNVPQLKAAMLGM